jgi:hypothetical protein
MPPRPQAMTTAKSTIHMGLALIGFVFTTACASFPPPTDTLANAIASVRGAEEIGADNVPQAALALQLAREEITKARALMAEGDNEPAYYQALRATSDADLALSLAREEEARKAAASADKHVQDIENEAKSQKSEVNP